MATKGAGYGQSDVYVSGHSNSSESDPSVSSGPSDEEPLEGYDYDFVPEPDPKYECPICLMVLRDPMQTKCGHRFCQGCIKHWLRKPENQKCPVDNEPLTESETFPDNFAKREILALSVKCPNHSHGCVTVVVLKKLKDHQKECQYNLAPCPNQCSGIYLQKDLQRHLEKECSRRNVKCTYCFNDIVFSEQEVHFKECPRFPVQCALCGADLYRQQMNDHIANECANAPVKCIAYGLGCQTIVPRHQLELHNQQFTQLHIKYLTTSLNALLFVPAKYADTIQASGHEHMGEPGSPSMYANVPPSITESVTTGYSSGSTIESSNVDSRSNFGRQRRQGLPSSVPVGSSISSQSMEELTGQFVGMDLGPRFPSDPLIMDRVNAARRKLAERQFSFTSSMSSGASAGDILSGLEEKNRTQEQKLVFQNQQILELVAKVHSLEKIVSSQANELRKFRHGPVELPEQEGRYCNGTFIWKIKDYKRLRQEAIQRETTALHSPGFYTSLYGYKLCIRLNLNGVDAAEGSYLSIFIHFMQGEYDSILEWPFVGKITLMVMDQNEVSDRRRNISETLVSSANLAAFQRPKTYRNHKGFGYMEFAPINLIETSTYVKGDSLLVKVIVETQ